MLTKRKKIKLNVGSANYILIFVLILVATLFHFKKMWVLQSSASIIPVIQDCSITVGSSSECRITFGDAEHNGVFATFSSHFSDDGVDLFARSTSVCEVFCNDELLPMKSFVQLEHGDVLQFGRKNDCCLKVSRQNLTFCTALLHGNAVKTVDEYCRRLGVNSSPKWTENCTHLLVNFAQDAKELFFALSKGAKIVTMQFLEDFFSKYPTNFLSEKTFIPQSKHPIDFEYCPSRIALVSGNIFVCASRSVFDDIKPIVNSFEGLAILLEEKELSNSFELSSVIRKLSNFTFVDAADEPFPEIMRSYLENQIVPRISAIELKKILLFPENKKLAFAKGSDIKQIKESESSGNQSPFRSIKRQKQNPYDGSSDFASTVVFQKLIVKDPSALNNTFNSKKRIESKNFKRFVKKNKGAHQGASLVKVDCDSNNSFRPAVLKDEQDKENMSDMDSAFEIMLEKTPQKKKSSTRMRN